MDFFKIFTTLSSEAKYKKFPQFLSFQTLFSAFSDLLRFLVILRKNTIDLVIDDIVYPFGLLRNVHHCEIKKKKKTYLCKDKIPLVMVLGCIYIHILVTCLH